jgi:histidine triad (HIT) family protein
MARRDWYCEDILSGKLEVRKVWQDDRVLAFHHPQPKAEIHVVVIPKEHVQSILDPRALDGALLSLIARVSMFGRTRPGRA